MLHKLECFWCVLFCVLWMNVAYSNGKDDLEKILNKYISLEDKLEYLDQLKNSEVSFSDEDMEIISNIIDNRSQDLDEGIDKIEGIDEILSLIFDILLKADLDNVSQSSISKVAIAIREIVPTGNKEVMSSKLFFLSLKVLIRMNILKFNDNDEYTKEVETNVKEILGIEKVENEAISKGWVWRDFIESVIFDPICCKDEFIEQESFNIERSSDFSRELYEYEDYLSEQVKLFQVNNELKVYVEKAFRETEVKEFKLRYIKAMFPLDMRETLMRIIKDESLEADLRIQAIKESIKLLDNIDLEFFKKFSKSFFYILTNISSDSKEKKELQTEAKEAVKLILQIIARRGKVEDLEKNPVNKLEDILDTSLLLKDKLEYLNSLKNSEVSFSNEDIGVIVNIIAQRRDGFKFVSEDSIKGIEGIDEILILLFEILLKVDMNYMDQSSISKIALAVWTINLKNMTPKLCFLKLKVLIKMNLLKFNNNDEFSQFFKDTFVNVTNYSEDREDDSEEEIEEDEDVEGEYDSEEEIEDEDREEISETDEIDSKEWFLREAIEDAIFEPILLKDDFAEKKQLNIKKLSIYESELYEYEDYLSEQVKLFQVNEQLKEHVEEAFLNTSNKTFKLRYIKAMFPLDMRETLMRIIKDKSLETDLRIQAIKEITKLLDNVDFQYLRKFGKWFFKTLEKISSDLEEKEELRYEANEAIKRIMQIITKRGNIADLEKNPIDQIKDLLDTRILLEDKLEYLESIKDNDIFFEGENITVLVWILNDLYRSDKDKKEIDLEYNKIKDKISTCILNIFLREDIDSHVLTSSRISFMVPVIQAWVRNSSNVSLKYLNLKVLIKLNELYFLNDDDEMSSSIRGLNNLILSRNRNKTVNQNGDVTNTDKKENSWYYRGSVENMIFLPILSRGDGLYEQDKEALKEYERYLLDHIKHFPITPNIEILVMRSFLITPYKEFKVRYIESMFNLDMRNNLIMIINNKSADSDLRVKAIEVSMRLLDHVEKVHFRKFSKNILEILEKISSDVEEDKELRFKAETNIELLKSKIAQKGKKVVNNMEDLLDEDIFLEDKLEYLQSFQGRKSSFSNEDIEVILQIININERLKSIALVNKGIELTTQDFVKTEVDFINIRLKNINDKIENKLREIDKILELIFEILLDADNTVNIDQQLASSLMRSILNVSMVREKDTIFFLGLKVLGKIKDVFSSKDIEKIKEYLSESFLETSNEDIKIGYIDAMSYFDMVGDVLDIIETKPPTDFWGKLFDFIGFGLFISNKFKYPSNTVRKYAIKTCLSLLMNTQHFDKYSSRFLGILHIISKDKKESEELRNIAGYILLQVERLGENVLKEGSCTFKFMF